MSAVTDSIVGTEPIFPPLTETSSGLFEMTLEVKDLARSERFYRDVIGLPVAARWSDARPAVWLALGREGFLGLWPPESGGALAIHGGRGGGPRPLPVPGPPRPPGSPPAGGLREGR